ncbi:hypothetical protein [Streptomyces sp. NPDC047042]|uniref:hypothetical protein n=1 Tax=Streptomyces sp. NPDC047042 TaxID=3154807 RepID=UPI0033C7CBDF
MRPTHPHSRTLRTARSVGLTALLAVTGATALAVAPTASAASTAEAAAPTATLTADVPVFARGAGMSVVAFGSLQIDDGTTVTCINNGSPSGASPRIIYATTYKVTAGTTYRVSAWESGNCDAYIPQWGARTRSLGGVTVTPSNADVAGGVYRVTIP